MQVLSELQFAVLQFIRSYLLEAMVAFVALAFLAVIRMYVLEYGKARAAYHRDKLKRDMEGYVCHNIWHG